MIKALLIIGTAFAMMLSVSGCGHSGFMFGQGKVITLTPEGFNYTNGIFAYDLSRENSEVELELSDANGLAPAPGSSQIKGGIRIRRRIGKQILGYTVDLAKESPESVTEWLKDGELKTADLMPAPGSDLNAEGKMSENTVNKECSDRILRSIKSRVRPR